MSRAHVIHLVPKGSPLHPTHVGTGVDPKTPDEPRTLYPFGPYQRFSLQHIQLIYVSYLYIQWIFYLFLIPHIYDTHSSFLLFYYYVIVRRRRIYIFIR